MTESVKGNADASGTDVVADPRAESEASAANAVRSESEAKEDANQSDQSQLERARQDAQAAEDRYLRIRADMENYKKRIERTYADLSRSSKKDLLRKLLQVKDNLERAVHYGSQGPAGEGIMEGVRLTLYQLDQLLMDEGVKPIKSEGQLFNPRIEEAVQSVDDPNVPDNTVVQVLRNGYIYQNEDDVLRPAQVVVSVGGPQRDRNQQSGA